MKPIATEHWLSKDTYYVDFGYIVEDYDGNKISREAEYHIDEDKVVITDLYWNNEEEYTGSSTIDPQTLKYANWDYHNYNPYISREEYDEIEKYVRMCGKNN